MNSAGKLLTMSGSALAESHVSALHALGVSCNFALLRISSGTYAPSQKEFVRKMESIRNEWRSGEILPAPCRIPLGSDIDCLPPATSATGTDQGYLIHASGCKTEWTWVCRYTP